MPLDLDPIRKRLEQTESLFWENDCRDLEDMCEADLAFISNAPAYVAALLSEVESLRAENEGLRTERPPPVAVCPDCGEVTRCDEDRCCVSCGRDLIILADRHSADLLIGLNGELSGLRAYLKRSIAADIGGDTEAWEIIDGLSDEDTAMIDRWLEAMQSMKENP